MTHRGHVQNGVIVLDEPVDLPEGAVCQVDLSPMPSSPEGKGDSTLAERLASVIGSIDGLPEDASINHDHYLYGAPKK